MKNNYLHQKMVVQTILFVLLLGAVGMTKAASLTSAPIGDTINAKTVGVIPYSDDFITQEEVMERNYAITSFRMIDTATVAVLTGASDMILVYSLEQDQILRKIQLPIAARAFEYDNNLFHVIGDRTYLSIDAEGIIHERKDFQQPNKEYFIITDLKIIDGQPVIHECDANTYSLTSDGLQKIDTFYCDHTRGFKIHPKYIDENSFVLYSETPSRSGRLNVSMESLGLEGKLSCLDYISVDNDFIAINLQTTYNRTGGFVKSYLLVVNPNGELINLVEVPINFLSYISKPFLYKDNAWYYAFSGQEGVYFFEIGTNTNMLTSPDSSILSDENIDYYYREPENGTSVENINNDSTRGNWRTITQAWYNASQYCNLEWIPISSNVASSCTWVGGSGYIKTPITSYGYTETGVPYKWGGYTSWRNYESLASQGKYTGNRVTTSSTCGGNAYSSDADTYVIGVDCSGYVSRCWEVAHKTTSTIPNICTSHGLVTSASSSDFQNMDALNKSGSHVMLYRAHNGSNQVVVFESSANDWKTSGRTYNISYFSGYYIQRLNYMKYIILRLNSAITLSQNGSTVTNVTQGEPLTVNYSVKNFGSETWTGYVHLYIEQSDGDLMSIKSNYTTLSAGGSASFTFSNQGVISPVGTTKLYVKAVNYDAGDYGEAYDVGEGSYANPKVFQIVPPTPTCNSCPDYDETWSISGDGEWTTKSSSIGTNGCRIYRVYLTSSYTYTFQTCGQGSASFDTRLYLYNASCNQVAFDDDGCSSGNLSSIEYTNTGNSGYYYLKIDGWNGAGGTFTIAGKRESSASPCSDCPNYDETWSISGDGVWTTKSSSIGSGGCRIYRVQLSSSYTYTFQTGCDYGTADFDTQLYLYDASCDEVAYNDDGCSYHLSSIEYTNTGSTAYFYLKIDGYDESEYGSYTIAAKRESPTTTYVINVSASPSAGGTVGGAGTYDEGSTCTLTATPNTGYTFTKWTKNGSQVSTSANYTFTVTENASYVAVFTQNSYTISASANPSNGGTVSGGGNYNHGSNCTLTATANTGYSFTNWTKNGQQVSTSATYSFTVTETGNYVANFSQNSYTISASANPSNGGTVSGGGTYNYGANCTLTATANSGYTFSNWTENGTVVSSSTNYSFTVTGSRNLVANFTANPVYYTITATANPSNGGTVTGGGSYQQGNSCTLTATANSGYTFMNWTKNGQQVSTSATYSFTVTEGANYVANFEVVSSGYYWTVNTNQYPNTMLAIGIIRIDGEEQATNTLELGAFCNNECRGREKLTYYGSLDRYLLFMTFYGNDGDVLNLRLYDHAIGQELDLSCTTTITFATNSTVGTATNPYVFDFSSTTTQVTSMPAGWTWWSTYIEQSGNNGLDQMEESLGTNGLFIKSQANGFVTNVGTFWAGQLQSIDNESTYLIQTSSACEMLMTGSVAQASAHPITLPTGWTWLGFPSGTAMSVSTALSGLTPAANDVLKSQESFVIYTPGIGWLGGLNTLTPGMGLMFESHNTNTMTLTYPDVTRMETLKENRTARGNHWDPVPSAYPDNMSVIAVVDLDGEELALRQAQESTERYELSVFANGECRGSARLMYVEALQRHIAFLTVYGDGEAELYFGLYDAELDEEYWDTNETLSYAPNAIVGSAETPMTVRFRGLTGEEEWASSIRLFPNPVNRGEVFRLGLSEASAPMTVEIVNALGVVVESLHATSSQTLKAPSVAGVYTLRITVKGQGICFRRLVVR